MVKLKREEMSLAEALAELRGKTEMDNKQEPEINKDRGPIEEIHLTEALDDLHGKPEMDEKREPMVGTGIVGAVQLEGGE